MKGEVELRESRALLRSHPPVATPLDMAEAMDPRWMKHVGADLLQRGSPLDSARLGDGCRHVFLDVGSNRGVHVRFLMEGPAVYPGSRYLQWGFFQQHYGPRFVNDSTICSFGFEPNPAHAERLRRLALRLRANGRRAEWFNAAASNRTGTLTMYHNSWRGNMSGSSEWGFSAFGRRLEEAHPVNSTHKVRHDGTLKERSSEHLNAVKEKQKAAEHAYWVAEWWRKNGGGIETVPMIDLGLFILTELVNRRIPPAPHGIHPSEVRPPSIIMKLDVEGAELDVLERMRTLNVLCEVDVITCELHSSALDWSKAGDRTPYESVYERYPSLFDLIEERSSMPTFSSTTLEQRRKRAPGATVVGPAFPDLLQKIFQGRINVTTKGRRRLARAHENKASGSEVASSCRTEFKWADDESYLLVEDMIRRPWE